MNIFEKMFDAVENHKDDVLAANEYIQKNAELGFREWKTHAYLKKQYEALGLTLHEAGDIPGFYTDIDTGRPGPTVGVFGEMDALYIPEHPQHNPETGAVHACGHCCQSAALYGIAAALTSPDALDGLCGKIRLFAVPAEEVVNGEVIENMKAQGVLHTVQGKQEFMYRGYLDGVDMAIMVHTSDKGFGMNTGCNGNINKTFTFIGKAIHAAGPFGGKNALYAATNAISATNALRETFSELNKARFHCVIREGGAAVNIIPDKIVVEAMVRGLTLDAILKENDKVNRAFASGAASMGCRLIIDDEFGCFPRKEDKNIQHAFLSVAKMLWDDDNIKIDKPPAPGVTDMGDVSMIMPVVHAFVGGSKGAGHSANYEIVDPYTACVMSAKLQAGVLVFLLENNAEYANKVLAEKSVRFSSAKEYFEAAEKFAFHGDAVIYNDDGSITLKYKN